MLVHLVFCHVKITRSQIHGFCFELFSSTFNLGPDFLSLATWASVDGFESKDVYLPLKMGARSGHKRKVVCPDLLHFKQWS